MLLPAYHFRLRRSHAGQWMMNIVKFELRHTHSYTDMLSVARSDKFWEDFTNKCVQVMFCRTAKTQSGTIPACMYPGSRA